MITISNPEKYIAGIYPRLSNEKIEYSNQNFADVSEESKQERESGSISTQKSYLKKFCKDNKIKIYDTYTDDGYSGANFERPGFKRMIKDIEAGKINMVIVKDLSRFGRNSSKVEYYLEEYFVEKGVRFIAIADDIDTGEIETSEDMLQFKAFFNEWFLRDCSKKVKNGKKARANEGKVMVTYPTYGYKKDPLDKNHYIIDEEIAPVVKKIFSLAKDGKTPTEIARIMTEDKARLPSDVVGNTHTRNQSEIKRGWNRNTVKRILQNITYLGWVRNGTLKKVSYKSKKILVLPKEKWIIKKGMHEPIIDEETFNIVQELIKSRTSTRHRKYEWLLHGLIYYQEGGKQMSIAVHKKLNKEIAYLHCNTYSSVPNLKLCTPHSNNLDKVTQIVLETVKARCREYLREEMFESLAKNTKNQFEKRRNSIQNEIKTLEMKVKGLNEKIDRIYEDKILGNITEIDFERIYKKNLEMREDFEKQIEQLKNVDTEEKQVDLKKIVKEFVKLKNIDRTTLVQLVDRIEISQDKEITIYYKFRELNVKSVDNLENEKVV